MPEETPIVETIREGDIYRQFAVTLLSCNKFAYDLNSERFSLNDAQREMSILGSITNRYLLKRIGTGTDKPAEDARSEANTLIERQKKFVVITTDKKTDYTPIKKESLDIVDEYDRLLLKHNIFK